MPEVETRLICGDAAEVMRSMDTGSVDLTVTSPPYDALRTYNGYSFDFEAIAQELYRVTKPGGVVVWVVGDASVNGSETGTSFRQALRFKEIGFNLHDTMIFQKKSAYAHNPKVHRRYKQVFEYMFVFSKGSPKTYNEIKDVPNKWAGTKMHGTAGRNPDNTKRNVVPNVIGEYRARDNIWLINSWTRGVDHPAMFPLALARDHVLSWSNQGDTVLDPMMGSGTVGVSCLDMGRNFVGIDVSPEYVELSRERIDAAVSRATGEEDNTP